MTPWNRAKRIVTLETIGHNFVVSLKNESWALALSVGRSAEHADQVALIARRVIAVEIAQAKRDASCHCAAEIDDQFLAGKLYSFTQAAKLCRDLGELHTNNCMPDEAISGQKS